ncbi:ABC transporter permease [Sphaerimonospora thailandensis]|uniref:Glycine/betaine ABC transporter permease n=1 Tax=Sphaerimonospora thailandensis TaxID=795644 RepID=A0A8J3VWZ7_9ACTN|nr:proline/glycine betaine ABC transporter permease [Sphaerimonospora thailandensis]GIH67877.1 glycine/betaine ABC transporter permease [Sphaerimonospora thailandensis]
MADDWLPRIPVGDAFESGVDWLTENLAPVFDWVEKVLDSGVSALVWLLLAPPTLVTIAAMAGLGWWLRGWRFGLISLVMLVLIDSMGQWEAAMSSLALVLAASLVTGVIAFPLGVLTARNDTFSTIVRPILDFMQTMPAFVYLIPAVMLFSIGVVPGIVATIIFAMPPGVRLTELGIRQVNPEMVEAGDAFGAPPRQVLSRVQIPLAMPSIMAGVNQVIMLALSMVVIAGMVGAGGLGGVVYEGITRLNIASGFEGGLAVVILAIYLDRVTAGLGARSAVARAEKAAQHA